MRMRITVVQNFTRVGICKNDYDISGDLPADAVGEHMVEGLRTALQKRPDLSATQLACIVEFLP